MGGILQCFLLEEILAGIGRESKLGKDDGGDLALRRLPQQCDRLRDVEQRVGDLHARDCDGEPDETVAIEIEERVLVAHEKPVRSLAEPITAMVSHPRGAAMI